MRRILFPTLAAVALCGLAALIVWRLLQDDGASVGRAGMVRAVPVEVADVVRGPIQDVRMFSGTLIPRYEFIVAPKVSGRVVSVKVDIGDRVERGQIVVELDDDEHVQAVAEAQAELEVAKASLALARSALEVTQSDYDRVLMLQERNIASGAEVDVAEANRKARLAQIEVAEAEVTRAEAALGSSRIRLGYTSVAATWSDGSDAPRIVSQRFVDEGATVAANAPIVTVVDLSIVRAILFVTERDSARLTVGQQATVENDAYPGETFEGRVIRKAPVFEAASRQVRVEVEIPNPDGRLKPGMYVRARVILAELEDAWIVPLAALTRRDGGEGVFVVDPAEQTVQFMPVRVGIVAGERVQVLADLLGGPVVTLGQQLLQDGTTIRLPQRSPPVEIPGR